MIFAVDFGSTPHIHTKNGKARAYIQPPKDLPSDIEVILLPKGISIPSQKFEVLLQLLLEKGDVVFEAPTPGSSGAEAEAIKKIVGNAPKGHKLYTIESRAVENYRRDNCIPLDDKTDDADAEIIYIIATTQPKRLREWVYRTKEEAFIRKHRSVRPLDKRGYQGEETDNFLNVLPPLAKLSLAMQQVLGDGTKYPSYEPAIVLPFAMAMTEPGHETRNGYEKILSNHDGGYPCFYRRAATAWMHKNAILYSESELGYPLTQEQILNRQPGGGIPRDFRKKMLKLTKKQIRELYFLMKNPPPNYM